MKPTRVTGQEDTAGQRLAPIKRCIQILIGAIITLSCASALGPFAQPAADVAVGQFRIEHAVFGLFNGSDQDPVVLVRVERAFTDYQQTGFFRIGVLPIGVVDGVTFELRNVGALTNRLLAIHRWVSPRVGHAVELRRVRFLVPALTNCLEATRARLGTDGRLELLDGVAFGAASDQMRCSRGLLQLTGPNAGQIRLETTPPWTDSLFARFQSLNR